MTDTWMTRAEVAAYLKVSVKTVDRRTKTGELPARRVGRSVRYLKAEIDALMDGGPATPQEPALAAA